MVLGSVTPAFSTKEDLNPTKRIYSLVLNLEVEMPTEPVVEKGLVYVARCLKLERKQRKGDK